MWQLARTPRWIAALVFALAVAFGFALLGQWQLSRAVASGTVVERPTETVMPLSQVQQPQSGTTDDANGQLVTVSGQFAPDSFSYLTGRLNGATKGYWVMGELVTSTAVTSTGATSTDAAGPSLAVALGWAPDRAAAASAVQGLVSASATVTLTGRYLTAESPTEDDFEHGQQNSASVAALLNQWPDAPTSVYGGYLIDRGEVAGLTLIDSPKPSSDVSLNWLNVFYAIEWVVFAGLAVFLWYRLLKDALERELEEAEERELLESARLN